MVQEDNQDQVILEVLVVQVDTERVKAHKIPILQVLLLVLQVQIMGYQ